MPPLTAAAFGGGVVVGASTVVVLRWRFLRRGQRLRVARVLPHVVGAVGGGFDPVVVIIEEALGLEVAVDGPGGSVGGGAGNVDVDDGVEVGGLPLPSARFLFHFPGLGYVAEARGEAGDLFVLPADEDGAVGGAGVDEVRQGGDEVVEGRRRVVDVDGDADGLREGRQRFDGALDEVLRLRRPREHGDRRLEAAFEERRQVPRTPKPLRRTVPPRRPVLVAVPDDQHADAHRRRRRRRKRSLPRRGIFQQPGQRQAPHHSEASQPHTPAHFPPSPSPSPHLRAVHEAQRRLLRRHQRRILHHHAVDVDDGHS
mmetsp:Transcript_20835/g.67104  ORF Transcript_20835/g.67104 Transcript_20835/m.67104 type:complete len:313 (+) Transcript_20835:29-967(+)